MKDLNNNPFFKSGNYLIGLEFNLSNSINLNNLEQISNNLILLLNKKKEIDGDL
jgi:hypothetical protein